MSFLWKFIDNIEDGQPRSSNWIVRHYLKELEHDRFEDFVTADRDIYLRWGVLSTLAIYASFFWMDWVLYPERAVELNIARGFYCVFIALFYLQYNRNPKPNHPLTLYIWVTAEALALTTLTVISGDENAPYVWSLVMVTAVLGMLLQLSIWLIVYIVIVPVALHHIAIELFVDEHVHGNHWVFMWTLLMVAGSYSLGVSQMLTIRAQQIFRLNRKDKEIGDRLLSINRDLESFNYSVAHDLKTPLRIIEGLLTEAVDSSDSALSSRAQESLELALSEAIRMQTLTQRLLEFSDITKHNILPEPVNLADLCRDLIKASSSPKTIHLECADKLTVCGDKSLLGSALANLIENAIKYSRDDKPLIIKVGETLKQTGERTFYFRDNGIGFDQAVAEAIFKPFFRVEGSATEGSGVGLSTVRRIFERHGGKIWAKSQKGEGATFYFTLGEGAKVFANASESERFSGACCDTHTPTYCSKEENA